MLDIVNQLLYFFDLGGFYSWFIYSNNMYISMVIGATNHLSIVTMLAYL